MSGGRAVHPLRPGADMDSADVPRRGQPAGGLLLQGGAGPGWLDLLALVLGLAWALAQRGC